MKNSGVCKGCKYCVNAYNKALHGSCDYSGITGQSRTSVERANGGVKKNSCVCYEKGNYNQRRTDAYGRERGGHDEG